MKLESRVERLEKNIVHKTEVWLTLFDDDDEQAAIERHERKTGVRLDPASVHWIRISFLDAD